MDCASFLQSLTKGSGFGCGFLVFGCFPQVFNLLGLFFMLCLGLKVLQFSLHVKCFLQFLCHIRRKSSDIRNGLRSRICFGEEFDAKIMSSKCGPLKFLENSKSIRDVPESDDDDERECCEEDQMFDVMSLRKLVKIERQRANMACMELEKERMAAASAADEAMAMILRLQREKSVIDIDANQYRRLSEQKQEYDKEVIQSLQWMVMKHEYERSLLDDKLKLCKQKLKQYVKDDDEIDQIEGVDDASMSIIFKDGLEDELIRTLDVDSSVW